ncbi:hypothetical protein FHS95_000480 [Sphingomonas naasensis]|uniref:Uncharacterized protein n=1 Tax=Sphingomonas naasensis TaxID=1344951 RepID=A0A4S1WRM2_9SPHN|nr:hypothetical protein [Sphingomonas naasensis]NIJ18811.1 hypothetical protein [Sphingomonas naasensis]TGX46039.1 hypothetical protein E5A74_02370 [Sphingomonas naasensis]
MATDDRRMHEGRSRNLDDREPHGQRDEESVIGADARRIEGDVTSTSDRAQESALGGDVATRSGTAETPEDERLG